MEDWFLLFGGTSEDGNGPGVYEGRTVDPEKALQFYRKLRKTPCSTGHVEIVNDEEHVRVRDEWDFSKENRDIERRCRDNARNNKSRG